MVERLTDVGAMIDHHDEKRFFGLIDTEPEHLKEEIDVSKNTKAQHEKTLGEKTLKTFGITINEIQEGPARRIQELYSDDYLTIDGKSLAVELIVGSKFGVKRYPLFMFLTMFQAAIPWIYRWRIGVFFKHDLDKFIQISLTVALMLFYMANLMLYFTFTQIMYTKMQSKRKLLCMIDPGYYSIFKIPPTLPILSMYKPFNYQQILNLFTIL